MTLPPVVSRTNVPTPPANATTTTLQVGTYNAVTDAFTLVLDLNDASNFYMKPGTLKLPQPPKTDVRSFNVRTPGERVVRVQRKNITVSWSFSIRGANAAAISSNIRAFMAAVENPPYVLRIALPGASFYSYLDIKKAVTDIPGDPILWNAKALVGCTIALEGGASWRGDRLTVQNLVTNPGFEALAGGAGFTQGSMPLAFNDPFANLNAYTLVGGGAMTLNPANTYIDVVLANTPIVSQVSTLLRYYRMGESAGTSLADISGQGQAATTHATPTLGTTGLISGDTDKAITFAAASSQYVSIPGTGLPSANGAFTVIVWLQIAANPASNQVFFSMGDGTTAHKGVDLDVSSTGHITADVGGATGTVTSTAAITTAAAHMAAVTWDGTTLILYVDGASTGTPTTPGAQTTAANPGAFLGALSNQTLFFSGILDEAAIFNTNLSAAQISNIWTAGHSGATGTVANAASIPASGIQSFGSPIWGGTTGVQQWQCRFRWVTGLTAVFYLHRVDANNNIKVFVDGSNLTSYHTVTGTVHQLAQAAAVTTHEAWYWVQITQFPTVSGDPPVIQAVLLYDSNGTLGTQIASVNAPCFDQVTAQSGACVLMPSGAALAVGGVSSGAGNQVQLFGPGGWAGVPNGTGVVTGQSSLSWDQTANHQYPNGPWTSFGAARIDVPPGGTIDARWASNGISLAQTGIPVRTGGDTLSFSAWYTTTSALNANATVALHCNFYTAAFAFISSSDAATATGAQTAWTQLSGTVVTPGTAAFVQLDLRVVDTTIAGESAGATIWFDNVTVWNQTQCGQTSMPYSELRSPNSPAQIQLSGLQGDVPAPAAVMAGTYLANWTPGSTLTLVCGRRQYASANAQLCGPLFDATTGTTTLNLDVTSFGGWYEQKTGTMFPAVVSTAPANILGAYHVFARGYSAQTLGNLGKVTLAAQGADASITWFSNAPSLDTYYPQGTAIYAAQNQWTVGDGGQITSPLYPRGALTDNTQNFIQIGVASTDTNGSPAAVRLNWAALIPVDGNTLVMSILDSSNGGPTVTAQWLFTYVDGLAVPLGGLGAAGAVAVTTGYSLESRALPNAGHASGGAGVLTTGTISVNPVADTYVTLDPTQAATAGGVLGVNHLAAFITDNSGDVLALHTEFQYAPLYLYPR